MPAEPSMSAESDLSIFFTKVDGSFPGRHRDLQPIITWKSSNTPVSKKFTLPIPVELSGSVVDYSFETLHNDIQFGVFFEESDDSKVGPEEVPGEEYGEEVIIETQLVDSYLGPVTGTIPLTRPGRLTMVWDNGYSWFKHKTISYSVTLHVPSLLATETAKCGRALNALRVCVKDRDSAYLAGGDAEEEKEEVDVEVESLQEQLRALQSRLDEASQRAEKLGREVVDCHQRKYIEGLKIRGLTFRVMPAALLAHTLSFGSKDDQWLDVCKDWLEALSPSQREEAPIAQD